MIHVRFFRICRVLSRPDEYRHDIYVNIKENNLSFDYWAPLKTGRNRGYCPLDSPLFTW